MTNSCYFKSCKLQATVKVPTSISLLDDKSVSYNYNYVCNYHLRNINWSSLIREEINATLEELNYNQAMEDARGPHGQG